LPLVDGEEDRDPAVGDLRGELDGLAADRAEVDGDLVADRVDVELERLALAGDSLPLGERQLEVLALLLEAAIAGDYLLDDLDVLARAPPGLLVGHAVPALGDLWARRTEAEDEAPPGEGVDRDPGHRGGGGLAGGDLEDRRAELDGLGLGGQIGEHADRVGAV